ncbi:MAG: cytochrome c [Acidobacteria bacterium]|nr:cytochrome c [Acidobacteriota bacterium]
MTRRRLFVALFASALVLVGAWPALAQTRTGKQVYDSICLTCHGPDGRGGVNLELEKIVKPPDFSDCAFAAREPDDAFLAVAHNGGPSRGFSPLMAPWGGQFSEAELQLAISHIRTFCTDDRWPRGELNLPRPLVTAKACPEDEAVVAVTSSASGVTTKVHYEKRFGALNMWEVVIPVASLDGSNGRVNGLGDIALEYKRTLAHSLARGNIVSVTTEVKLPTGNEDKGLGSGFAVFEPFLTFGQVLGGSGFLQAQAGVGLPLKKGTVKEAFWRAAVGTTVEQGRFGRIWSPMVEILGARELESGAPVEWDVLPGVQMSLNKRQHVRLAGGVRMPVTQRDHRKKSAIVYLLWDWYEGGFLQGW